MILVPFFEIPNRDKLAKNVNSQYVQVIPRSMCYSTAHFKAGVICHKKRDKQMDRKVFEKTKYCV